MKKYSLIILLSLSSGLFAEELFKSTNKMHIVWIETGWYADGIVIAMNQSVQVDAGGPVCEWQSSVFMPKTNPMMQEALSIALAAQMANKPVMVAVAKNCGGKRPELRSIQVWNS